MEGFKATLEPPIDYTLPPHQSALVQETLKEDLVVNAKVLQAVDAYIKHSSTLTALKTHMQQIVETYKQSSTNFITLTNLLKDVNISRVMKLLGDIQNTVITLNALHATLADSFRSLS
ncbi:hypothetical protein Tco_1445618 [Tanacetum coccineum]